MKDDRSLTDILRKRRSVRNYLDKNVEKSLVDRIIDAALLSPSSRGINPWEFIIIEESETIQKLAASKEHGSSFLSGAPLVIAVMADTLKSDVWIEDCSIASLIIQLGAEEAGLGSCWVQIRKRQTRDKSESGDYVRKTLDIPENYEVLSLIGIGYPAEINLPPHLPPAAAGKCRLNRFGTFYNTSAK